MMTRLLTAAVLSAGLLASAQPAAAAEIEKACIRSDRPAASRALCGCIQDVADLTLSQGDQRRAAKFFADPHKAQEVRQSDSRGDEAFWQRYRLFGEAAKTYCS